MPGGKTLLAHSVVVQGQTDLHSWLEQAIRRAASRRLHRRQQQGNENSDDRDDDQQFHQGKTASRSHAPRGNAPGRTLRVRYEQCDAGQRRASHTVCSHAEHGNKGNDGWQMADCGTSYCSLSHSDKSGRRARAVKRPIVVRPSRLHSAGGTPAPQTAKRGFPAGRLRLSIRAWSRVGFPTRFRRPLPSEGDSPGWAWRWRCWQRRRRD